MARSLYRIAALLLVFGTLNVVGFVTLRPSTRNLQCSHPAHRRNAFHHDPHCRNDATNRRGVNNNKSPSALHMGYNLPPGKGGGGGGLNEILGSVATIALGIAFFMSPLGGIFFALFNSFLAFIFLAPALLVIGFQAWQYFNTVEGACPACGAPLRVMKDQNQASICLNCGAFVAANGSGGIGFAGGGGGGGMGGMSDDDVITDKEEASNVFSDFFDNSWGAKRAPTKPPPGARKDLDIIDAVIEDEDKPFM